MDAATASAILLQWLPRYLCGKSDPQLCAATGASSDCSCSQDPVPRCGSISAEWSLPCNQGLGALVWVQFSQGALSLYVWNGAPMSDVFPTSFPGSESDAPELFAFLQKRCVTPLAF
jgi:hypothetical protein